jgi:putative copper resistance protein D
VLLVAVMCVLPAATGPVQAQSSHEDHVAATSHEHGHSSHEHVQAKWEGSSAGIAYSERNHHIAGWLVLLMGVAEVSHALRLSSLAWTGLLLPGAMTVAGVFLLVWSDHEAWPIGSMSLTDTFFGRDLEIIQHKVYGLLALVVGGVEAYRRLGRKRHAAWATPLPLMAIIGGLLLFGHSHGDHPSAHKVAMHHAVMGFMAITAGSSKLWSRCSPGPSQSRASRRELLWAGLVVLIGLQLLFYTE